MNATTDKVNGNGNGCTDVRDSDENDVVANENKGTGILSDISLPNDVLERLFQRYSIKQRQAGLECFLATSVLFDVWVILVPQPGTSNENIGTSIVFLIFNLALALFLRFCGNNKYRGAIWEIAPHLAWILAIAQLNLQLFFKGSVTTRDSVGYAILLNFLVYVTLPVPLKFAGIILGAGTFIVYGATANGLAKRDDYFWHQQVANALLMATAAVIGLMCYFLGEAKQRRAFLEAKQSLEVKMVIEEQSTEQERLLLSVLPEHVAVKVRQDLGSNDSEQFKKIYMSRHENVSILFADIVGFTAISSTYSAQDLVKMLNELFARFDRLAEKYHQLRIKILGDCYYCISGAIERPDHAVLCVHMGLSMVKAIKYVQQKTNSPVDMRVGIHTGAVLAGILGQRQWQYDVYSKDVELANKMESSGQKGRVHISEKTLQCLSGEFEVEPAFGEKREESLRSAGLKTYFIKKVLVPFVSKNELKNGGERKSSATIDIEDDGPSEAFKDEESKCNTPDDEVDKLSKEEIFKNRLRTELVSRDGHGELSKDTTIFLQFKNKDLETEYTKQRESMSSLPLVAALIVQIVASIYSSLLLPSSSVHFLVIFAPVVLILPIVWISVAESFPMYFSDSIVRISKRFNDINIFRRTAAVLTISIVGCFNLIDMLMCVSAINCSAPNHGENATTNVLREFPFGSTICTQFPSYFSNYAILILIATSVVVQLTHMCKFILMFMIAGLHCYVNIFGFDKFFGYAEIGNRVDANLSLRYSLSALLILISIALGLLSRHMDKEDRVIFKWKTEVAEQKEMASDMRLRNEKLVYNILPVHVAEYFIRNKSRSYDELYSQSYDEVGVLFASMPNFSDFYSEDAVNNQGLECLRFLNEVISDFDALLGTPQFQNVIKIKTIGSTYMAASGLNNVRYAKADDSIAVRWNHLATLVEFALELKKALQCINEQSFNHFVLKMGINHGPITAGVIGARKPHYDTWGNTVNVASRMESTGKANAIQVTQETCEILQTFGYTFEQRGLVAVKGKGQLMTYYLSGKLAESVSIPAPNENSPPKSNTSQINDLNHTIKIDPSTQSQQSVKKSTTSSVSSCSNSPSSVRINQNYNPNNLIQKSTITNEETNGSNNGNGNETGNGTDADCDLDASGDADSKPLLKCAADRDPQIVTNIKRSNRYDRTDEELATKAGSDNENEILITNNHD